MNFKRTFFISLRILRKIEISKFGRDPKIWENNSKKSAIKQYPGYDTAGDSVEEGPAHAITCPPEVPPGSGPPEVPPGSVPQG